MHAIFVVANIKTIPQIENVLKHVFARKNMLKGIIYWFSTHDSNNPKQSLTNHIQKVFKYIFETDCFSARWVSSVLYLVASREIKQIITNTTEYSIWTICFHLDGFLSAGHWKNTMHLRLGCWASVGERSRTKPKHRVPCFIHTAFSHGLTPASIFISLLLSWYSHVSYVKWFF